MSAITDRLSTALADRYRILRHLGEGGMANVYLAEDLKHDRQVAIKVLRPELAAVLGADRFVQEIKTTASLQHPHILPLFDSGTAGEGGPSGQFLYYVMPYIEGETLRDKLKREAQLGVEEAVRITTEVAEALQYAHEQGVIHRDIKPENILLTNGRPIVADFGIALAVSAAAGGRMTETGLSLGTPHYMSPEQATAERNITNRTDIYSLAAVLYELLTGDPPHTGSNAQQVLVKIMTDPPRPVSEFRKSVPPNVAGATAKALEKLPADRFASAQEFAQALSDPSYGAAASAAPETAPPAMGTRRWIAYGAGLALALATGFWIGSSSRPDASPRVARLSITLDDGDDLLPGSGPELGANQGRPRFTALAFSPDGETIVFGGRRDGVHQLFRRSIAEAETSPIAGTENAESPIFSPDGSELAFWSTGWLRRVPLAGGTPVQVAEVSGFTGASWGDDGRIVFSVRGEGLKRITVAGADRVEDLAADSGAHLPFVLPGSKAVLYTVRSGSTPEQVRIEGLDLEDGVRTTVIDNASDARYVGTGHLLFARVGQLMAVAYDPSERSTTGAPIGILPDLMHAIAGGNLTSVLTDAAQYAVSQVGHLAWLSGGITPSYRREVTSVDRQGIPTPVTDVPAKPWFTLRLSPDQSRLSLASYDPSDPGLSVFDLERATVTPLFSSPVTWSTWSPDSRELAFGITGDSLHITAADGASAVTRTLPVPGTPVAWTPEGEVLFLQWTETKYVIRAVDLESGEQRLVLEEAESVTHPALSPDGQWLAYTVEGTEQVQLVVRSWPDLEERQVISNGPGQRAAWSGGGAELLFQNGDSVMAVDFQRQPPGLPRLLFSSAQLGAGHPIRMWDVTDDGMHFFGSRRLASSYPPEPEIHVILNWFDELKER